MSSKIRVMVPKLMKERNLEPMDLFRKGGVGLGTAYTLADEEKSQKLSGMSFDVLAKLCDFLGVNVSDILVYTSDNGDS